jgi:hypothetical protein
MLAHGFALTHLRLLSTEEESLIATLLGYGNDCCILGPFVGDGSTISRPRRRPVVS